MRPRFLGVPALVALACGDEPSMSGASTTPTGEPTTGGPTTPVSQMCEGPDRGRP